MNDKDVDDLDEEDLEYIRTICGFLEEALQGALDEVHEEEYGEFSVEEDDDVFLKKVIQKHVGKRLDYLQAEGWVDEVEFEIEDEEEGND
jgi:hypothetical protein